VILGSKADFFSVEREKAVKEERIANNSRASGADFFSVEKEKSSRRAVVSNEERLQALAAAERARRAENAPVQAKRQTAVPPPASSRPSSQPSKPATRPTSKPASKPATPAQQQVLFGGLTGTEWRTFSVATIVKTHPDSSADVRLPNGEVVEHVHPNNLRKQEAGPPSTAASSRPGTGASRPGTAASAVSERDARITAILESELAKAEKAAAQRQAAAQRHVSFGGNAPDENVPPLTSPPSTAASKASDVARELARLQLESGGRGRRTLGAARAAQSEIGSLLVWE